MYTYHGWRFFFTDNTHAICKWSFSSPSIEIGFWLVLGAPSSPTPNLPQFIYVKKYQKSHVQQWILCVPQTAETMAPVWDVVQYTGQGVLCSMVQCTSVVVVRMLAQDLEDGGQIPTLPQTALDYLSSLCLTRVTKWLLCR